MDRFQYLGTLKYYLRELPNKEQDAIIMDYREYFIDGEAQGLSDEEVSEQLGDPEVIATDILKERPTTESSKDFNENIKRSTKSFIEGMKDFVQGSVNVVNEKTKNTSVDESDFVPNEFSIEKEYSNIDIKSNYVKTILKYSEDSTTYFSIDGEYDTSKVDFNLDNDTLTVKLNLRSKKSNNYIEIDLKKVTIYIPRKTYNHISIKSNMGTVWCKELSANTVDVVNNLGNLKIDKIITDDLVCKNSVGDVRVKEVDTKSLDFKVNTGKMIIKQINADIDVLGKVATGDAQITLRAPFEDARFSLTTSMGTINTGGYHHGDIIGEGKHNINMNVSLGNATLLYK